MTPPLLCTEYTLAADGLACGLRCPSPGPTRGTPNVSPQAMRTLCEGSYVVSCCSFVVCRPTTSPAWPLNPPISLIRYGGPCRGSARGSAALRRREAHLAHRVAARHRFRYHWVRLPNPTSLPETLPTLEHPHAPPGPADESRDPNRGPIYVEPSSGLSTGLRTILAAPPREWDAVLLATITGDEPVCGPEELQSALQVLETEVC